MEAMAYTDILNRRLALNVQGRFEDSYRLLTNNMYKVGGNMAQIYNFRYCSACRMGDPDLAMDILSEAVTERGYWYPYVYLRTDEDLGSLHEDATFWSLLEICREREAKAKTESNAVTEILTGGRATVKGLLVAPHGDGENLETAKERWAAATAEGFEAALIQSSMATFSDAYNWDDLDRGRRISRGSSRRSEERTISITGWCSRVSPPERDLRSGHSHG
jgi:hypothetical protein